MRFCIVVRTDNSALTATRFNLLKVGFQNSNRHYRFEWQIYIETVEKLVTRSNLFDLPSNWVEKRLILGPSSGRNFKFLQIFFQTLCFATVSYCVPVKVVVTHFCIVPQIGYQDDVCIPSRQQLTLSRRKDSIASISTAACFNNIERTILDA